MNINNSNIKTFVESDPGSNAEKSFLEKELSTFYDKKQQLKYERILSEKYDVKRKENELPSQGFKYSKIAWVIGLLLILGVSAYLFLKNKATTISTPQQYAAHFIDQEIYLPMNGILRGNMDEREVLSSKVSLNYEEKNLEAVISNYEKLKESFTPNNNERFMTAIALTMQDELDRAITLYSEILQSEETMYSFHQESRWHLVNCYLLASRDSEAKLMLQNIKPVDYKFKEAQDLMKLL